MSEDRKIGLYITAAIFILIEVFLIKVTKTHELFLDATFFLFLGRVRQFVLIRCKNHFWENYIIRMQFAK